MSAITGMAARFDVPGSHYGVGTLPFIPDMRAGGVPDTWQDRVKLYIHRDHHDEVLQVCADAFDHGLRELVRAAFATPDVLAAIEAAYRTAGKGVAPIPVEIDVTPDAVTFGRKNIQGALAFRNILWGALDGHPALGERALRVKADLERAETLLRDRARYAPNSDPVAALTMLAHEAARKPEEGRAAGVGSPEMWQVAGVADLEAWSAAWSCFTDLRTLLANLADPWVQRALAAFDGTVVAACSDPGDEDPDDENALVILCNAALAQVVVAEAEAQGRDLSTVDGEMAHELLATCEMDHQATPARMVAVTAHNHGVPTPQRAERLLEYLRNYYTLNGVAEGPVVVDMLRRLEEVTCAFTAGDETSKREDTSMELPQFEVRRNTIKDGEEGRCWVEDGAEAEAVEKFAGCTRVLQIVAVDVLEHLLRKTEGAPEEVTVFFQG